MRTSSTLTGSTIVLGIGIVLIANCSANGGSPSPGDNDGVGGDRQGLVGVGGSIINPEFDPDAPPTPGCADGVLTDDEACDDGNFDSGDGCAGNCRALEAGWSCATPGEPCIRIARCGDGYPVFPELCDDGNSTPGDGCSATCKVEVGYKCEGTPSDCTHTVCGDGVQEGAESCEDDDAVPFDGCSSLCQAEPNCATGDCTSECGDGLVLGEECDDGNNIDGDGCSADCREEPGYTCSVPQPEGSMVVPAVFRDFTSSHSDFERGVSGSYGPTQGMVEATLDAEGKPVFVSSPHVTSADSFAQWYRDVPGTNSTTATTMTLWDKGDGRFVNRYGAGGEQYQDIDEKRCHCGTVENSALDAEGDPMPCTTCYYDRDPSTYECDDAPDVNGCSPGGECADYVECQVDTDGAYWGVLYEIAASYDGNPLFFPVDADPFTPDSDRGAAKISTYYGGNWAYETGEPLHNYHFTSEVRFWFQYDGTQTYVLDFTGDDDVWVFINNRLAVDIGGIHSAVNGTLTIGADSVGTATYALTEEEDGGDPPPPQTVDLGMTQGKVYEIAVFHAERQTDASTFQLTLQGFATARSECSPICGDSIVALGEECDDGENDGGYGECGPGCSLGSYCGDGIVNEGEDCDDGNNLDGDSCGSACRNIVLY